MLHALKPFHCPNCNVLFTSRDIGRPYTQKFPIILPCNHSVCDCCLSVAVKTKSNFSCPICKVPVDLSSGNESIAKLYPDLHALGILNARRKSPLPSLKVKMVSSPEMLQKINSGGLSNSTTKVCDNCSQVEALWQCDECQSNFCNICFDKVHKKKHSRKKHEVKKIFAELYNTMVQSGCSEHKNKSVEFYCERDDQLTCSHCMLIGNHIGHEVKTLVDKNRSCANDLKNVLADVSEIERRLKYTEHLLTEVSSEEKVDVSEYIKSVHDHFHSLHSTLQVRESELISKLEEIAKLQNEPFEKMVFEISGYQKDIASIKRDAESVIENPCLAVSAPYLLKKLESFKEIPCYLLPLQVNVDKNIKIDLELSDALEKDIHKHGSLEYTIKPRFHLVPTQDLPDNYCTDIPATFVPSEDDTQSTTTADSFSEDSLMVSPNLKSSIAAAFKFREFNKMHPEAVTVSHIKDPSCFWVQKSAAMKKFTSVSSGINRFCRSQEANYDKHISLERGDLYLVQFSEDKMWYRGRVKRIIEPGDTYEDPCCGTKISPKKGKKIVQNDELKVEIYYIDYGNSEVVSVSKLRNIQPCFMHFPAIAKQCCLADVVPANGKVWSIEAIKSFSKFVNQKHVIMQIYEERNNILHVDLSQSADTSISNDVPVSVRDALVFQEFAVFPSGKNLSSRYSKAEQRFLPPERLRANADIAVIVSHVDSPSHFYVQQISTASYLSELIIEMTEAYSREENSLLHNIYVPHVGMICAARFSVDKQWYRAQVKSLPGGSNVEVQYVDFGNSEIVRHKFIRKLSDKFCKLNIQAIPCRLADVTYNQDTDWSTKAKGWLTTKVSKKQLTLKSTGFDSANNKAEVILYYIEEDYELCINALLVEAGLASSCGPGSSEAKRKIDVPVSSVIEMKLETALSFESIEESNSPPIRPPVENPRPPTLVKKFPDTEGHHMEVHVTHIKNPSVFYIRIAGDIEKKFQKLMTDMQKAYTTFESLLEDCGVGKSYAVFSDIRKKWFRGTILSIGDKERVKVQFVDCGAEEEISTKNVHKLLDIFTVDEEYSICCELTGIIPAGGSPEWSFAACDAFRELVSPHEILHLSVKGEIQKETIRKQRNLPVSLFTEELKVGGALEPTEVVFKNIATELVSLGLALPIRVGSTTPSSKSLDNLNSEKSELCDAVKDNPPSPVKSLKSESPIKCSSDKEQTHLSKFTEAYSQPVSRWKSVVYPMEPKFKGFVTNIGEDGSIQLHAMRKGSSVVEMIKKALHFKYSKLPATSKTDLKPPVGTACIAKFSVDSLWYRAEVIEVYPGKVKVNFVDYGNNEIVPLTDIRTDIIMQTFPKQCIDCLVTGIHTGKPGQWDDDLLNFLHSQLVESIVEVEPLGPPDVNGKLPCHIVTNCGVSITELLQSMGFMESDSEEFMHGEKAFRPATDLREGDIFPVCITQINSPNIVYLQRLKIPEPKSDYEKEYNKEHDAFLELIKELQDNAESFPEVEEPMPGMACCAKYSYDNNWYRCEITDLEENGAVVLYVDYGNSETASFNNLRTPSNRIIDFPVQVYFCEIHGMSPVGSEWDPDVKKFLVKKLLDSGLEIFAKVVVPGKISQVDLMVKNDEGEMKLAYEELLDMNLIVLQQNKKSQ